MDGYLTLHELLTILTEAENKTTVQKLQKILEQQPVHVMTGKMDKGRTLLHYASMFRSTVAVKAMLKMECWKTRINDQDEEGYTPLMLACRIKGSKVAETLLDHEAKPDITTAQGQSVVHYCSIAGDMSFLRYMAQRIDLKKYCRLQAAGKVEPIHLASQHGNTDVLGLLVELGADVNVPDSKGRTPLFLAVLSSNIQAVEILRKNGAQFLFDTENCNAMMMGLMLWQSTQCVCYLLREDLRYITAFSNLIFDLDFTKETDDWVRGVLGRLLENNYNTSIELRREMEGRTKEELKQILRPAALENENGGRIEVSLEIRSKIKRFIAWLTYCYHAIDFKKRRAEIPEYVLKQKKASFPGYFSQRWKNPNFKKIQRKLKIKKAQSAPCSSYLAAWHVMDDIWEKINIKDACIENLSNRAKCFLLDCYHLWTKGTAEEQQFCTAISSYKDEIQHVLEEDPTSLQDLLCYLGALARIPELDDFINETLYNCDLNARKNLFYTTIRGTNRTEDPAALNEMVKLEVDRFKIFESSCDKVMNITRPEDLFNLSVTFMGEDGQGIGIRREWINELNEYILDFRNGLFTTKNGGLTFQPSRIAEEIYGGQFTEFFHVAGKVIGFSLLHGNTINVHFTNSFYKHILDFPLSYKDLPEDQVRHMETILTNDVSSFELTFAKDETDFLTGELTTYNLIEDGANIPVTEENKARYVELYSTYIMTESIKAQIDSFVMGFYSIIPKSSIRYFKAGELELLLCGLPQIDHEDWKLNTEYDSSEVVTWFWEIVAEMSQTERHKLLLFWSAFPRVPYGGFAAFEPRLVLEVVEEGEEYLPHAHTCFKVLKVSGYSSKEMLGKRLRTSVQFAGIGHGIA